MSYDASADDDRDGGASPVYDYSNEDEESAVAAAPIAVPATQTTQPQASSTHSSAATAAHTVAASSTATAAAPSATSAVQVQRADSSGAAKPATAATAATAVTRWPISFGSQSTSSQPSSAGKKAGSGSKRKTKFTGPASASATKAHTTRQKESGSRFVECPACQRTLPHFELDAHLESCGLSTTSSTQQSSQSSAKKRKTDLPLSSATSSADKGKSSLSLKLTQEALAPRQNQTGSSFGPCLLGCGSTVILANMGHHMDLECRNRPNKKTAATTAAAASSVAPAPAPAAAAHIPPAAAVSAAVAGTAPEAPVAPSAPASLPLASGDSLVIPESEPVLLIESTQEPMDDEGSQPLGESTVAAVAAAAAAPVVPHAFFTAGPRAAAAFVPQRRGRNDHVKCSLLVHFTAGCAHEASPAPISALAKPATAARSPGTGTGSAATVFPFVCEWQDIFDGAAGAASSSSSSASHTPSLCSLAQLSPLYHSHTKYVESAEGALGTDVHLHASSRFLDDSPSASSASNSNSSPVMDFTAESLALSGKHRAGAGRRFNLTLSQLKSLLQKNIRLSRPAAAVRSAFQLMSLSVIEFLRRFAVVMLEDAVLHPGLPYLVWLTSALGKKSGFVLRHAHVDALLSMVHEVASVGIKDGLQEAEGGGGSGEPPPPPATQEEEETEVESKNEAATSIQRQTAAAPTAASTLEAVADAAGSSAFSPSSLPPPTLQSPLPDLDPSQRQLVKCLLLRACMGGSEWDVRMLRSYAALWNRRFHAENFVKRRQEQAAAATLTPSKPPATHAVPPSPATSSLLSPSAGCSWLAFLASLYAPASSAVPPALRLSLPIRAREVQAIQDEDLVLSAVDQHCSNIVDRVLENPRASAPLRHRASELGVSSSELLPQLLWTFRSSLTNKHDLRPTTTPPEDAGNARLFAQIKGEIDSAAKKILAARIQH